MLTAEHLEQRGVRDPAVLRVMRSVRREQFVPASLAGSAYEDRPLDIGYSVTISQPYIVAAMTQLLALNRDHRVLEIGTGSGYQAAILAELAGAVFSIEVVTELAALASGTLRRLGYSNVEVRHGDGYAGWPEEAPFHRIVLTAAPLEVPQALVDQLSLGGRLVAPIGPHDDQQLILIDKSAQGHVRQQTVFGVSFVPMLHPDR